MQNYDHAVILNAYLSRLTLGDLKAITQAAENWTYAALHHGNSSQLEAQAAFFAVICNAVNNITAHDIEIIEGVTA